MEGLIIKKIADKFTVYNHSKNLVYNAVARGNLKKENNMLLVGDKVMCSEAEGEEVIIEKLIPRENVLVRPPIANVDNLIILITKEPAPDLMLVDKLIVQCNILNIEPIIVISKLDILDDTFVNDLVEQYKNAVNYIIPLSSKTGEGANRLIELIKGKTSSLVGQSAVGKSSLINMFGAKMEVGDISVKTKRGKNTTRHTEIWLFEGGVRLADTAGFSRFYLSDIKYSTLMRYYNDFIPYAKHCKYSSCVHIFEKDDECSVKIAKNSGKINLNRYNRYVVIYNELKKQWSRRYD